MDPSERLSLQISLAHLFAEQPLATDLVVSAFSAACKSSRRATVCKPFPTHIVGVDAFDAAAAALDALDPHTLTSTATDTQLRLLQWLLLHQQRPWLLSPASISDVLEDARTCGSTSMSLAMLSDCCCLLRLDAAAAPRHHHHQQQQKKPGLLAFHGTNFGNLHSILQHSLLAASGTRLQTTGAVFGHGIYLSTDLPTSFAYSKATQAWHGSSIGTYLRSVLICSVDEAAVLRREGQAAAGAADSLPDKYIVAPRPSDVRLKYVLVYRDDALLGHFPAHRNRSSSGGGGANTRSSSSCGGSGGGAATRRRFHAVDACWLVTAAYIGFMLLLAAWQGTKSRKW